MRKRATAATTAFTFLNEENIESVTSKEDFVILSFSRTHKLICILDCVRTILQAQQNKPLPTVCTADNPFYFWPQPVLTFSVVFSLTMISVSPWSWFSWGCWNLRWSSSWPCCRCCCSRRWRCLHWLSLGITNLNRVQENNCCRSCQLNNCRCNFTTNLWDFVAWRRLCTFTPIWDTCEQFGVP